VTVRDSQFAPLALRSGHAASGVSLVAEEEFVRLLKGRSLGAWELLFERHFDRVYRYALGRLFCREAAEDVAAAAFDRALRTINSYSYRGRPILAWLYGIAGNIVKETLRNEARERRMGLVQGMLRRNDHQADDPLRLTHADTAPALAARMDLDNALRRLTRTQREVVLLRYFAGLSATETGQIIGRPETAVYALQARALAALRRQLT
jgi:RNA polymerase sigma-70 factor, ECF subfamily